MSEKQWLENVSIIHTIAFLSLHEAEKVILDDWILGDGTSVGAGSFKTNSITESKDVVVLIVLKSVLIHIDTTVRISETSIRKEFVGLGWWVDASRVEVFLNCYTCVDVPEDGNLLSILILFYF